MIDLSSEAAFTVSRQLRVLTYNQKAERVIGLSAKEAIGRSCADVVRAEWPSGEPLCGLACEGRQCFASETPFSVQRCLARRGDGSGVLISLSTMIIPRAPPAHGIQTPGLLSSFTSLMLTRPSRWLRDPCGFTR